MSAITRPGLMPSRVIPAPAPAPALEYEYVLLDTGRLYSARRASLVRELPSPKR